MATTKAQLESKVASLTALLNAEVVAHAASRAAMAKLDAEWKATVYAMRKRHALEYRRLSNTTTGSIGARTQRATGETNAEYVKRMREQHTH